MDYLSTKTLYETTAVLLLFKVYYVSPGVSEKSPGNTSTPGGTLIPLNWPLRRYSLFMREARARPSTVVTCLALVGMLWYFAVWVVIIAVRLGTASSRASSGINLQYDGRGEETSGTIQPFLYC